MHVANGFFTYYPKGTLVYPLERIRIAKDPGAAILRVRRETASGGAIFPREFLPTSKPGDSVEFKVRSMDQETGQISYALTFAATAPERSRMRLVRRSEQTISVRGF